MSKQQAIDEWARRVVQEFLARTGGTPSTAETIQFAKECGAGFPTATSFNSQFNK